MRSYLRKIVVLTLVLVQMMCMTAFAQNSATAAALEKVNAIRVANGLSEVRYDASLEQAANVRAQEASTSFSHTRPDGSAWYTVNDALMYGENLAEGYNSADEVVDAWMASPALPQISVRKGRLSVEKWMQDIFRASIFFAPFYHFV